MKKQQTKILIVDDDEGILDALSLLLEEMDFAVDTTPKGDQALHKISSFNPDLIILDILMSGCDGREICKKIKADKDTKHIPVIMISAHPSAERSVKECGANNFFPKPFEIEDLIARIKQLT